MAIKTISVIKQLGALLSVKWLDLNVSNYFTTYTICR